MLITRGTGRNPLTPSAARRPHRRAGELTRMSVPGWDRTGVFTGAAMDPSILKHAAEWVSLTVDAAGALIMVVGLVWALGAFCLRSRPAAPVEGRRYRTLRQDVGRAILLGLEFMVAGDIIRTVAVEPTINGLVVLGGIVLIRTFLSLSLEIELEGRLPWRSRSSSAGGDPRER